MLIVRAVIWVCTIHIKISNTNIYNSHGLKIYILLNGKALQRFHFIYTSNDITFYTYLNKLSHLLH